MGLSPSAVGFSSWYDCTAVDGSLENMAFISFTAASVVTFISLPRGPLLSRLQGLSYVHPFVFIQYS